VCWQLTVKLVQIHCSMVKNSEILSMLADKKYPNCRLYDIEKSKYVTVEDIRRIILKRESITVVDSKTEKDLTRAVLRQTISEQERKGYESILKSRALAQLVRFYGGGMQSIMTFLEQDARTSRGPYKG
jgi:polyhydroxyalkanoate synthesis repressor PhaR